MSNDDLNANVVINPSNKSNNGITKTFGLLWNPQKDSLLFPVEKRDPPSLVTKRSILSTLAQMFDPLGLLSPLIVTAKVMLQQLWHLNLTWDESVPMDIYTRWVSFENDVSKLSLFSIPQHVTCETPKIIEIHDLADTSETAYGACVYLHSTDYSNKSTCVLLCSKTRVAPLKTVTIPRLELCAALILAELVPYPT